MLHSGPKSFTTEDVLELHVHSGRAIISSVLNAISFFQIGGIHGLPYLAWDGAGEDDPAEQAGYCTHGSVLFPTWHRPYVALYEVCNIHISPSRILPLTRQNIQQILQKHAIDIAETYTVDKQRWQQVAADLRQPFWDWARNSVPPSEVISLTQVTITTPDGKRTKVDNPLFHYAFHPIEPSFPDPYINWRTTFRHPTTLDADAKDNVAELKR